jgi:hypothetical protein
MPAVDVATEIILSEPFMMHHVRTMHRWTITIPSSPSYRCVIQECPCGLRDQIGIIYVRVDPTAEDFLTRKREIEDIHSVPRVECLCTARICRLGAKARTCHGWHRKRIDQLIASIEKMPKKNRISTSMHSYQKV